MICSTLYPQNRWIDFTFTHMAHGTYPWYNCAMKKLTVFILTICVLFTAAAANAASPSPAPDVTPSPTPAPNPAITPYSGNVPAFSGLIGMNYSGDDVVRVQIRLRDLCYFNFKPTGIYQSMTANAAKAFQLKHTTDDGVPMISDGTIGDQTMTILFRHGVSRADIAANIPIGTSQVKDGAVKGEAMVWSDVKAALSVGSSYLVTDYNTGSTFYLQYAGGENHAEMEVRDSQSSAAVREVFGGEFNFSKRAVTVTINGKQIAASLQGWPHGSDTIPSTDMNGHLCLYFDGSLSHVGSLPDAEHQELVYRASGQS